VRHPRDVLALTYPDGIPDPWTVEREIELPHEFAENVAKAHPEPIVRAHPVGDATDLSAQRFGQSTARPMPRRSSPPTPFVKQFITTSRAMAAFPGTQSDKKAMSKKEFAKFISRQHPPVVKDERAVDWVAEKNEWLQYLADLPWHFGGRRAHFVCKCGRRVRKLYAPRGYPWRCRHCYELTYATRQAAPRDRLVLKAQKIREVMGGNLGVANAFPAKTNGDALAALQPASPRARSSPAEQPYNTDS
jgi:hypothetical protein